MKFPQKAIDRFNAKINKSSNCHEWNASKQKQGYGMFSYDGKSKPAHRFSYLLHKGDIAENMVVYKLKVKIKKITTLLMSVKVW